MKASELIKIINDIQDGIGKAFEKEIQDIIKDALSPQSLKSKNAKKVTAVQDLDGWDSSGFYMIFNNATQPDNHCTCTIEYGDETKKYTCVYRGHSSHITDRLKSHLFYSSTNLYPNCMQVIHNGKKYNINIASNELFNKDDKSKETWNACEWLVVKITLSSSKQGTREMFEGAFDSVYQKPIYSCK